jgi:2'-5' RNA ligase
MKLFIGIKLPHSLKIKIHKALQPIKKSEKGWEHAHDYHLTLLFIGEVTEEDLKKIKTILDEFELTPFDLQTKNFEFFPRRVIYLSLYDPQELLELKKSIDLRFKHWLKPQTKPFLPHITVKRYQRYECEELKKGINEHPFDSQKFPVLKLTLFKSEKDYMGNKYQEIY